MQDDPKLLMARERRVCWLIGFIGGKGGKWKYFHPYFGAPLFHSEAEAWLDIISRHGRTRKELLKDGYRVVAVKMSIIETQESKSAPLASMNLAQEQTA